MTKHGIRKLPLFALHGGSQTSPSIYLIKLMIIVINAGADVQQCRY
jgi:hypothetical protein